MVPFPGIRLSAAAKFSVAGCLLLAHSIETVTAQTEQCSSEDLKPYSDCVTANTPCPCSNCDPDPTDGTPLLTTEVPKDCTDVLKTFCPLVRCCSLCEQEAIAWYQPCTADPFAEAFLQRTCELDCSGFLYRDSTCAPTMSPTVMTLFPKDTPAPSQQLSTMSPTMAPTMAPTMTRTASPAVSTLTTMLPTSLPTTSLASHNSQGSFVVVATTMLMFTRLF